MSRRNDRTAPDPASPPDGDTPEQLRVQIAELARRFFAADAERQSPVPGQDYLPVSGKLLDADDLVNVIDASLDLWFTAGRFAQAFEQAFADFMAQRYCLLVNSGSSANLLAFATLMSRRLGARAVRPGDEVIVVASGFPTTVNPVIQLGCIPVFVDISLPTYQVDVAQLEQALGPRTRAVMIAHTLGNAFEADAVAAFCRAHGLWLVEDCCDAVGTRYQGRMVGTFGDLATVSFYPAHHITMGEGGALLTRNPALKKVALALRDWGRDCWCDPGRDNTCGKRFDWDFPGLPAGFDHKYVYGEIGYNLKVTDLQAALGVSQLAKLPEFIARRQANFATLTRGLEPLRDRLLLPEPTVGAAPSWFGYPITLQPGCGVARVELVRQLEARGIGTRLLFGGNLARQPAYQGVALRRVGDLAVSDRVMRDTFWIGLHPSLGEHHMAYMAATLVELLS